MKTIVKVALGLALAACFAAGCDDPASGNRSPDLASASPDLAPTCVTNPTTHEGLLNGCTDAESYDKTPFYPTLAPNGELPALP